MPVYSGATDSAAAHLATATGMHADVAKAWLASEAQDRANYSPTNPLNIQYSQFMAHRFGAKPLTTSDGVSFPDLKTGLDAAAWVINNTHNYRGVRAAIATNNPVHQAIALAKSPWSTGHYGFGNAAHPLGSIMTALGR